MPHIVYKMDDEGTSDPFIARMMFQNFKIREAVFPTKEGRDSFDTAYEPVLQNLREARLAKNEYIQLVNRHEERVNSGACIEKDSKGNFRVTESVDLDASLHFKDVYIRGKIALDNIIEVGRSLGIELGFIYDSDKSFEEGLRKIAGAGGDPTYLRFVCGMIEEARGEWMQKLISNRNDIEHKGFCLPELRCDVSSGTPKLVPHKVQGTGQDIREAIGFFWNNLWHFSELLVILLLTTKLPKGTALMMIPNISRDPKCPVAFKVVPEPQTDEEGPETWKEYREEAEKAATSRVESTAAIRITDLNGEQLAVFQYFPNDKGAMILSIDGLPLEMILVVLHGKDAALSVRGRAGVYQTAQIQGLNEEEFLSWAEKIGQKSSNSMIGSIIKSSKQA